MQLQRCGGRPPPRPPPAQCPATQRTAAFRLVDPTQPSPPPQAALSVAGAANDMLRGVRALACRFWGAPPPWPAPPLGYSLVAGSSAPRVASLLLPRGATSGALPRHPADLALALDCHAEGDATLFLEIVFNAPRVEAVRVFLPKRCFAEDVEPLGEAAGGGGVGCRGGCGRGACVGGACVCDDGRAGAGGFWGARCDAACPESGGRACGGRGYCRQRDGRCACDAGFDGAACAGAAGGGCGAHNCSGHGRCGDGGACECASGWRGVACADSECGCSGHGRCFQHPGSGAVEPLCQCVRGWAGADCEEPLGARAPRECPGGCNARGVCDAGTGLCRCAAAFAGADCGEHRRAPCPKHCSGGALPEPRRGAALGRGAGPRR
jgi:hypothetical protein